MKLWFIFLIASFGLRAEVMHRSKVIYLDAEKNSQEIPMAFLASGKVVKLSYLSKPMQKKIAKAQRENRLLEFRLSHEREVISFEEISTEKILYSDVKAKQNKMTPPFVPSVIGSPMEARAIFQDAKKNTLDSQCFNRAHVWAYEWRLKYHLFTSKAWLFFSRKYIRKFDFEWWFHVAPYFHVIEAGRVVERIADVKYAKGPINFKAWTDIFVRNKADCSVVDTYSEQANYPESRWCSIMKSSMYYYQPIDLELLELDGIERTHWSENELKMAYQEAFEILL
jgi:hypothetical protein